MKRYSTSIGFKFWTDASKVFLLVILISIPLYAQNQKFSSNEREIIRSVIAQFKKECSHVSVLDDSKLREIQNFYDSKRESMSEDVRACYGEYLSQLVGTHNVHRKTCDTITPKKNYGKDKDLARIFVNVRKYNNGIRSYHEKLNECITRKGRSDKDIVSYTDLEKNGRTLSRKIRELDLKAPFKENSVEYR